MVCLPVWEIVYLLKLMDYLQTVEPGSVAQSVVRLTQEPEVPGSIPHTLVSPSTDSRRAVVSYW